MSNRCNIATPLARTRVVWGAECTNIACANARALTPPQLHSAPFFSFSKRNEMQAGGRRD